MIIYCVQEWFWEILGIVIQTLLLNNLENTIPVTQ